ncbi:MAG TPA: DNA primase, partial [Gammaproteobacteria bacterium]
VQARFLFLPDGEDPDSLVRKEGKDKFEQRLDKAMPLSDYLLDALSRQVDINSGEGRARLSELAKPLIAKLADSVFKDLLLEQLSKRVGLSKTTMQQHMPAAAPRQQQREPMLSTRDSKHHVKITPVRMAIALLLQHPDLGKRLTVPEQLHQADIPGVDLLLQLHNTILQTETHSPSALLERWRDTPEVDALTRLMQLEIPESDQEALRIRMFEDSLEKIYRQHKEHRMETLLNKSQNEGLSADEKQELRQLSSSQH